MARDDMAARTGARAGLTLVESLVVMGIISIVLGLVLPAVHSAREAARKLQCAGNLKQIALALHSYQVSWGGFPPAAQCGTSRGSPSNARCFSVQSVLLPYLEQEGLFDALNLSLPGVRLDGPGSVNLGNSTILTVRVGVFLCPSDPQCTSFGTGWNSYRANVGICALCREDDSGSFAFRGLGDPSIFRDGLSNTIAFSEKPVGSVPGAGYAPFRDWIAVATRTKPVTGSQWVEICSSLEHADAAQHDAGRTWLLPGGIYTWFYVSVSPNSLVPDCGVRHVGGVGVFAARSYHPSGVNAAMADGAARFFASTIARPVWQALGTRNGGEVLSNW